MTRTVYKEFQWCEGFEVYSKGKTLTAEVESTASEARPSGQTQLHPPSPGVWYWAGFIPTLSLSSFPLV